jgi:hypothetical protein
MDIYTHTSLCLRLRKMTMNHQPRHKEEEEEDLLPFREDFRKE